MKKYTTAALLLGSLAWIGGAAILWVLETVDLAIVSSTLAKHLVFFLPGVTIFSALLLGITAYLGAQTSGFSLRFFTLSMITIFSIAFAYSLTMNLWLCEGFTHLEYARGFMVIAILIAMLYVVIKGKGEKDEK